MRNISYYIAGIVVLGAGVVSFWIYQKYFKVEQKSVIAFQVTRGDIHETVSVRGQVVSQKEFEMEFPFAGTVEKVFVKEGATVTAGQVLMKLETRELDLERARLAAIFVQNTATLAKLLGGAQVEDLKVSESKVSGAKQVVLDAEKTLLDGVRNSFTLADDAIYNKADQFFNNPRTSNLSFNQTLTNTQLKVNLEAGRQRVGQALGEWVSVLPTDVSHIAVDSKRTQQNLLLVKLFLSDLATAVNSLGSTGSISQATVDSWKTDILAARTAIDGAITTVVTAEEKVRSAESALALAESELVLKKSRPRSEDVVIAEAQIDQAKNAIAIVDEKIRKSTLRAPGTGTIKKLLIEQQEVFKPGMTALIFASSGYKIQSDVSELDISKIRYVNGNDALIRFDAFLGKTFKGKVVFIEPKEVIKNDDIYFHTDIFLENKGEKTDEIRSGMSADVVLYGVLKKNVLLVPEIAVEKKGGRSVVKVAQGAADKESVDANRIKEQEVVTGISDGESVEVLSGVAERDIVVVSSN